MIVDSVGRPPPRLVGSITPYIRIKTSPRQKLPKRVWRASTRVRIDG